MISNSEFGARFKQIRLEKGVTEKEMGKAIGHTEKYIKNIENGVTLPTLRHFFRICSYFGITAYLFFNLDIEYPIAFNKFLKEWERLNDDEKALVNSKIKEMVKANERKKLKK